MNGSAYWDSQINYYLSTQPPKAESYYNKDFATKINEARQNIDNLVAEKDKSWAATGQRQDDYDAFRGSMSTYGEVYKQSKREFGVEEHQENYEKSKKALALAESTLSALPSSINSSSNRVLTQQQREARYNTLADRAMSYRDNLQAKTSAYEEVWKNAREQQATYAKAEMAGQYGKLSDYNNAYITAMNQYMKSEERLTQGKAELFEWESAYRDWQFNRWQYENDIWLKNLSSALARYTEALNTEMVMRQTERMKAQADMDARSAYDEKDRLAQSLVDSYYAGKRAKSNVYQKYLNLPSLNWY